MKLGKNDRKKEVIEEGKQGGLANELDQARNFEINQGMGPSWALGGGK